MEHNRWAERHVYYTLTGEAKIWSPFAVARRWLEQGHACARPESIAGL